jgi:hypothetical protein
MAIDFVRIEGARVVGQLLTFLAAALMVAKTARLLVSAILNGIRVLGLGTGPGAIIVVAITLIVEGVLWYAITTEFVQKKIQGAFLFLMQNVFPGLTSAMFSLAGKEFSGTGDSFTEPFLSATEEAAREMVDKFSPMSEEEANEFKDEMEAEVERNERPEDPNAEPENRPAPRASSAPVRSVATPDQSISQQINTLDW